MFITSFISTVTVDYVNNVSEKVLLNIFNIHSSISADKVISHPGVLKDEVSEAGGSVSVVRSIIMVILTNVMVNVEDPS